MIEYLIGIVLAFAVAVFAAIIGLDRGRSFYATIAIVVATYYILFAALQTSNRVLLVEIAVAIGFLLLATVGFKGNYWFVPLALIGHGVFDFFHHSLISNPGVPSWWPAFCLSFDITIGGLLLARMLKRPNRFQKT